MRFILISLIVILATQLGYAGLNLKPANKGRFSIYGKIESIDKNVVTLEGNYFKLKIKSAPFRLLNSAKISRNRTKKMGIYTVNSQNVISFSKVMKKKGAVR